MRRRLKSQAIRNLMGSAQLFTSAVNDLAEGAVLRQTVGRRVTPAQLSVLQIIQRSPDCSVGRASGFLGVSKPAASKMVDHLVRDGYLYRFSRDDDRRTHLLRLTRLGQNLVSRYAEAQAQALAALFHPIRDEKLAATARLLDEVAASLLQAGGLREQCLRCGPYAREDCALRLRSPEFCFYEQLPRGTALSHVPNSHTQERAAASLRFAYLHPRRVS